MVSPQRIMVGAEISEQPCSELTSSGLGLVKWNVVKKLVSRVLISMVAYKDIILYGWYYLLLCYTVFCGGILYTIYLRLHLHPHMHSHTPVCVKKKARKEGIGNVLCVT